MSNVDTSDLPLGEGFIDVDPVGGYGLTTGLAMLVDVLSHCVADSEGATHDPTLAPVLLGGRVDLFIAGFLPLGILSPGRGHGRGFIGLGHRQKKKASSVEHHWRRGDEGGPASVSACLPKTPVHVVIPPLYTTISNCPSNGSDGSDSHGLVSRRAGRDW